MQTPFQHVHLEHTQVISNIWLVTGLYRLSCTEVLTYTNTSVLGEGEVIAAGKVVVSALRFYIPVELWCSSYI